MATTLSPREAKAFYDRFGAKQDSQGFYEDEALDRLVANAAFGSAKRIFELGCGTGRFAERLLAREAPAEARYAGLDVSSTMVELATRRLARFGDRVDVRRTEGETTLPFADASFDRFVSTYVLDLMPEAAIDAALAEAARVLEPDGRLALVSLTPGRSGVRRLVSSAWSTLASLSPRLVGGCRPIALAPRLDRSSWDVVHHEVLSSWGISSEVLVARRRASS